MLFPIAQSVYYLFIIAGLETCSKNPVPNGKIDAKIFVSMFFFSTVVYLMHVGANQYSFQRTKTD